MREKINQKHNGCIMCIYATTLEHGGGPWPELESVPEASRLPRREGPKRRSCRIHKRLRMHPETPGPVGVTLPCHRLPFRRAKNETVCEATASNYHGDGYFVTSYFFQVKPTSIGTLCRCLFLQQQHIFVPFTHLQSHANRRR